MRTVPSRRLRHRVLRRARSGPGRARRGAFGFQRRAAAAAVRRSPAVCGPASPATGYVYADVSPGLALFLGMIPGVGAIYNGQYAKGMVHAIIWGVLM